MVAPLLELVSPKSHVVAIGELPSSPLAKLTVSGALPIVRSAVGAMLTNPQTATWTVPLADPHEFVTVIWTG